MVYHDMKFLTYRPSLTVAQLYYTCALHMLTLTHMHTHKTHTLTHTKANLFSLLFCSINSGDVSQSQPFEDGQ